MNYNLVNFCEFDPYATKSYCAIHNEDESKNLGDITKVEIENLPKCDIITHGSPCQDFSIAGNQNGADEGSGTRSSLIWNSVQIIKQCQPKFVIWENVKNVLSQKHIGNFNKYVDELSKLGYCSYYKILNARNYGIPQSRERIFCISIRKDIDCGFKFPIPTSGISLQEIIGKGNVIYDDRDNGWGIKEYKNYSPCQRAYRHGLKVKDCFGNIRKLTSKESTLLTGFKEVDYEKMKLVNSDGKIFTQNGNSIVVSVVLEIFKELQRQYPNDFKDLDMISLFSGIGAFEKALGLL